MPNPEAPNEGLVVSTHGRHVVVEDSSGERRICHPRGKKNLCVVGDRVVWISSAHEGTIESVRPRRNLMYRQDEVRIKSFAANIDQTLILLAAEPEFSERQLARALIAAEAQDIQPLIVLNKSDLGTPFQLAWKRLQPYRDMGYEVLGISLADTATATAATTPQPPSPEAAQALARLESLLTGKTTLVMGPSGAGKSTLINRWVPHARVATNEISKALNSGKHTTTSTHWYWVGSDRGTALIDSPGFQEFGLHHIGPTQLASFMPDLRRHLGNCKYSNCTHLHEPGCGVIYQMKNADNALYISDVRYKIYQDLFAELSAIRHW